MRRLSASAARMCVLGALVATGCTDPAASPPVADAAAQPDTPAPDTIAPDTNVAPGDTNVQSCGDPLEPNDWLVVAAHLPAGEDVPLRLCEGDIDLFALPVGTGGLMHATLTTPTGTLLGTRLGLYAVVSLESGTTEAIATAARVGDALVLDADVTSTEAYVLRVDAAAGGAPGEYALRLDLLPAGCTPDAMEPNDEEGAASPLDVPGGAEATLCAGEVDWYRVDAPPATHVRVTCKPAFGVPGLALSATWGAEPLEPFGAGGFSVAVAGLARTVPTTLLVRVSSSHPSGAVPYTLEVEGVPQTPPVDTSVSGAALYEDQIPTYNGYEPGPWLPAAGVRVQVVRAFDEIVVAEGFADEAGSYALTYGNDGPPPVRLRALTTVDPDATRISLRTGTGADDPPIAFESEPFESGPTPATLDLRIDANGVGAAFNALDVARRALELMEQELGAQAAELTLVYAPGHAESCGTCYLTDKAMLALDGDPLDDDAYDDAVVAHEVGHHFEYAHAYSDSPGGYHDGRYTDPRLAWSEGFANAFAAAVTGVPSYVDVKAFGTSLVIDIESVDHAWSFGTSDGTMAGAVSEDLVAAVLWDLVDAKQDGLDQSSAPVGSLLVPGLTWLPLPAGGARGFPGVDLVDFLDAWICEQLGPEQALELLVVKERLFPYDLSPPSPCLVLP